MSDVTGDARDAVAASDERQCARARPQFPSRHAGTERDDLAAELVAHHEAGTHVVDGLQVAAADAARMDAQHELAGSG